MITRELKRILSKIYIKDTIFFGICVYKFIAPEICLGDNSLSGDISLSPTKGEGPLVRASSPTIISDSKKTYNKFSVISNNKI
jgi:hypothetical protein